MVRYVLTIGFCCLLLWVSTACAPGHNGPEALSEHGYRVSLHVSDPLIRLGPAGPAIPNTAAVVVRVRDAQGQPVDGIAVVFSVEPSWTQNASFTPAEALTRNGQARSIFRANTTGVVPIMARADNVTRTAHITVAGRPSPPDNGSWLVPSWPDDRAKVWSMLALAHTGQE
jgi:hypothetical protein